MPSAVTAVYPRRKLNVLEVGDLVVTKVKRAGSHLDVNDFFTF